MSLLTILYSALAVFAVGNTIRILRIATMPVHLRWELYPIPSETHAKTLYGGSYFEEADWWTRPRKIDRLGQLRAVLQEVFCLKGIWLKNRDLWLWSWLLHVGLYFMLGETTLTILCACLRRAGGDGILHFAVSITCWAALLPGASGALGLLIYRAFSPKLRPFNSAAVYFNLFLIFFVFVSGLVSLVLNPATADDMIALAAGLLTFQGAPDLQAVTGIHIGLLALFLVYFPFSHMTHMYLKYFAYHSVRWDDAPSRADTRVQAAIIRSLGLPVSWAAPHIRGDGKKSWKEVAAEEVARDAKKH